jgi:hypothetical protein
VIDFKVMMAILKWIFKKWDWEAWTGLIWLRMGTNKANYFRPTCPLRRSTNASK